MENIKEHLWNMSIALDEAEKSYKNDEVPVGAVVVFKNGPLIGRGHNLKEKAHDPCGHAEILALKQAAQKIKNWRLTECILYVTLEPCPMCLGAMIQGRIGHLVFGAYDPKGGALGPNYNFYRDIRLNHTFPVIGGIRHYECSRLLSQFFKERRNFYK